MLLASSNWLGLHLFDWLVLIVYFVVVVGIGVWSYKKVQNMSDFFMGGRRFGKVFMMFFAFGAGTSSEQAISVVAGTWRAGLAGIWWQFLWLWATPFYWIIAPVMRRMRALTTADFFQARYNTSTATLYSIYGMIMSIVFIAGGLYGSGKMVNALTGGELDTVAQRLDIQVPQIKWNPERNRFDGGILFDTEDAFAADLQAGVVPGELKDQLTKLKRKLSDDVQLTVVEPNKAWRIQDREHELTYSARLVTVKVKKAADAAEQGKDKTAQTRSNEYEDVPRLRIYGSGWRLLEGYELAILAMTVMFVIYGMAGGLGAAIVTDFIQGILTIIFSFLLLPFVFGMIGGFGHLHDQGEIKAGMFDMVASPDVARILGGEPITIFYVFMLSATALAGIVVQPHIMGVCGAGKTEFEGRFGFTFGNFLKRFCTIAWTFTGLACIVWYLGSGSPLKDSPRAEDQAAYQALAQRASPEFKTLPEAERLRIDKIDKDFADSLFGRAAYDILPKIAPGLVGLLLASLLAAVMSTSDAQMVVSSGLFTENIYRRFLFRNRSQHHYLWVGRLAGLVIVALALILQSTFTDVIDALQVIIKTPAAIGISLWFGIVWRRWTSAAVWVSTLVAAATWAGIAYFPEEFHYRLRLPADIFAFNADGKLTKMTDAWLMCSYLSAGIVSGIVVSLLTPRVSQEKLDHFYLLLHTPITPGEEVASPCTLPENPAPPTEKLFKFKDIEIQKPTFVGLGGFVACWVLVFGIVWLTQYLARAL